MPDFQERGAHDYRQDAILTISEFERIVIRCIIHYNCERVIENYPYSSEMLDANVPPFANKIWNWKLSNQESSEHSMKFMNPKKERDHFCDP